LYQTFHANATINVANLPEWQSPNGTVNLALNLKNPAIFVT
jgi:hypothetical protein